MNLWIFCPSRVDALSISNQKLVISYALFSFLNGREKWKKQWENTEDSFLGSVEDSMYLHNSVTKTRNRMVKVLFKSTEENRERKDDRKENAWWGNVFGQEWRGDFFDANSTAEPESRIPKLEAGQMPCYHKTELELSLCSANRLQKRSQAQHFKGESGASKKE